MPVQVTCGSVIKLKHVATGFDLHSHDISYGSGSGQQSVTGYEDTSDANSLWTVRGAKVTLTRRCQGQLFALIAGPA